MILCDTNVIIEIFKGDEKTIRIIERIGLENIEQAKKNLVETILLILKKKNPAARNFYV